MKTIIIIPFYNEENRIDLKQYFQIFENFTQYQFLLVNDGSTDKTLELLFQCKEQFSAIEVLHLPKNVGKAEAIRAGVLHVSNAETICYLDADLATPFSELDTLIQIFIRLKKYKIIMGARIKLIGNGVNRTLKRHYLGRIFATIVSQFILKTAIYDTQCGAKIIDFEIAKQIFEKPFISKWLFDVELLKRLQKTHQLSESVKEIPLENWNEISNSKIKLIDFLQIPYQLFKIYRKYV